MISIFTPVHPGSADYIQEAYASIIEQNYQDWEWVVLVNGGLKHYDKRIQFDDPRVRVARTESDKGKPKIGRLKKVAASLCSGDILVELDADDYLHADCLAELVEAFKDPDIMFAYSNDARFRDGTGEPDFFSSYWGWTNRPFTYKDKPFVESVAWPPSAQSFRRVESAPDHVRAWRRSAYQELGGHDVSIISGDDHDLMVRTYLRYGAKGIRHIDRCLYFYRVYQSTSVTANSDVQAQVYLTYLSTIYPLAERWADDNGLLKIDCGAGSNPQKGYIAADIRGDPSIDLDKPWPWADNSCGIIRMHHSLEHTINPTFWMEEAYRCLAHGGFVFLEFPQSPGKGSHRDPTHRSFMNEQTIWYFTQAKYAKFIGFKGRYQVARTEVYDMERDVPVVVAELIAVKDGPRIHGELLL